MKLKPLQETGTITKNDTKFAQAETIMEACPKHHVCKKQKAKMDTVFFDYLNNPSNLYFTDALPFQNRK